MPHRDGKKFGGSHRTFTDLAAELADIAAVRPEVKTISAGVIQTGNGATGGDRRVKFSDMRGGLLLQVRQSRSIQDVRIITTDPQATRMALALAAINRLNARIAFQKPS